MPYRRRIGPAGAGAGAGAGVGAVLRVGRWRRRRSDRQPLEGQRRGEGRLTGLLRTCNLDPVLGMFGAGEGVVQFAAPVSGSGAHEVVPTRISSPASKPKISRRTPVTWTPKAALSARWWNAHNCTVYIAISGARVPHGAQHGPSAAAAAAAAIRPQTMPGITSTSRRDTEAEHILTYNNNHRASDGLPPAAPTSTGIVSVAFTTRFNSFTGRR